MRALDSTAVRLPSNRFLMRIHKGMGIIVGKRPSGKKFIKPNVNHLKLDQEGVRLGRAAVREIRQWHGDMNGSAPKSHEEIEGISVRPAIIASGKDEHYVDANLVVIGLNAIGVNMHSDTTDVVDFEFFTMKARVPDCEDVMVAKVIRISVVAGEEDPRRVVLMPLLKECGGPTLELLKPISDNGKVKTKTKSKTKRAVRKPAKRSRVTKQSKRTKRTKRRSRA